MEPRGPVTNFYSQIPPIVLEGDMKNNWSKWIQKFNIYLLASGFQNETEERKIALLLHSMGDRRIDIYNSFNLDQSFPTWAITPPCGRCGPKWGR